MSATDQIRIKDLELEAKIGAFAEEHLRFQRVVLDLTLEIDLRPAGASGRLEDTICYFTAAEKIRQLVQSRIWNLVEELATAICRLMFDFSPKITAVRAEVRKFVIPGSEYAGVQIKRQREDLV